MQNRKAILTMAMMLLGCTLLAATLVGTGTLTSTLMGTLNPSPDAPHPTSVNPDTTDIIFPDIVIDEEDIPDSLLHSRWPVQRTTPVTFDDLQQGSYDL